MYLKQSQPRRLFLLLLTTLSLKPYLAQLHKELVSVPIIFIDIKFELCVILLELANMKINVSQRLVKYSLISLLLAATVGICSRAIKKPQPPNSKIPTISSLSKAENPQQPNSKVSTISSLSKAENLQQPNFKVSTISSLSKAESPTFQKQQKNLTLSKPQIAITNAIPGWNKNLMVDNVPYDLYIPHYYSNSPLLPCILVLPGWNFPRTSRVENTSLVKYAEQYGYALILPEMGKTLYESSYYPQTRMKWNRVAGGQFIKDRFIPTIQQRHNLLRPGQYNTILGLSTGGRGVALIALQNPGLFVAGASLSGDFSQEHMPEDRLMTAVYGAFAKFPKRWIGTESDNPQAQVRDWQMPLYLAPDGVTASLKAVPVGDFSLLW